MIERRRHAPTNHGRGDRHCSLRRRRVEPSSRWRITRRYRIAFPSERTWRSGAPTTGIPLATQRRGDPQIFLLDDLLLGVQLGERSRSRSRERGTMKNSRVSALVDRLDRLEERLPQAAVGLLAAQQHGERRGARVPQPPLGRDVVVGQLALHGRESEVMLIDDLVLADQAGCDVLSDRWRNGK